MPAVPTHIVMCVLGALIAFAAPLAVVPTHWASDWHPQLAAVDRGVAFTLWILFAVILHRVAEALRRAGDVDLADMLDTGAVIGLADAVVMLITTLYWSLGWPPLWSLGGMRRMLTLPALYHMVGLSLASGDDRAVLAVRVWSGIIAVTGAVMIASRGFAPG